MAKPLGAPEQALLGRDEVRAAAHTSLDEGYSLLLSGRPGDGLTALARTVVGSVSVDGPIAVTGLAGLADQPLAALVMSGAIPATRSTDNPTTQLRDARRFLEVSAKARPGPLLMLVEGLDHLDDLSLALLVRTVMDRTIQMVAVVPLGTDRTPLHPLLSGGMARTHEVSPLPDATMRQLAPDDADLVDVERALALADGSPLWFHACLASGWVNDGRPLSPVMRDLADWHLSRLDDETVRALEMVALVGAVPVTTLVHATSARAVAAARDGAFLRAEGDHLLVRSPFHRARLREHANLHRAWLAAAIEEAARTTRERLPLLEAGGQTLDGAMANRMVHTAPRDVLDALEQVTPPLPEQLVLARGRARLDTLDIDGAVDDLAALLASATDPAVRTDAAIALSMLQAHVLGDMGAARRTIQQSVASIDDPALVGTVRTHQVMIEVYGDGLPAMEDLISDPGSIPAHDHHARLRALKSRAVLHAGRAGDLTAHDLPELQDLLARTAGTATDRWEALVPMMWKALWRDGVKPAMQIADAELERARAQGDQTAIATWLHSMAHALALAGHTHVALATIRRGLAALATIDRFGLAPQLQVLEVRAAAHLGDVRGARTELARITARGPLANAHAESMRIMAAAEVAAMEGKAEVARDRLAESLDHSCRIGWPLLGWSQVATSASTLIPSAPAELAAAPPGERFVHLTAAALDADIDHALAAMRALADMGWPAAAAALGRQRTWTAATPRQRLAAQHVIARCQAVATPGLDFPDGPASARQLEVARRATEGASDVQIADELGLSPRTISNHLARLYDAADVGGREDLADLLAPVDARPTGAHPPGHPHA